MTTVTGKTLAELSVPGPGYDRRQVTTGIVHIGVGDFHRSHQALYVDTLINRGVARTGASSVSGYSRPTPRCVTPCRAGRAVHPGRAIPRRSLHPREIGSIIDYLFAPDDPEAAIERLAEPATRIVSLTVTEGGYNLDATGEFDVTNPAVGLTSVLAPRRTPSSGW